MFDSMRRHLKNLLLPHPGNNNRPHLLRKTGILVLATLIIVLFGLSVFRGLVVNQRTHFTAAVLPMVLVNITNEDRTGEGLSELVVNPVLEEAARMKAEHMAEHSYFAHISPDGLDPWYWFYRAGYVFTDAGENLAVNFSDSEDVVQAWMDSPGHRANILNGKFTEIGIAAVRGKYKGKNTIFVVQMFGKPAKVASVALPPLAQASEPEPVPAVSQPSVAGVAAQTISAAAPAPVVTLAQATEEAPTKLIKEDMNARVEGAIEPAEPQGTEAEVLSPFTSMGARPRAVVSWIYLMIGLLISFVIMLMVYKRVHTQHPHSIVYGCALLALITLLSYFNYLLLSADLIIV
jgi:hypothetical protein